MGLLTVKITWLKGGANTFTASWELFNLDTLREEVSHYSGVNRDDFYLLHNGRLVNQGSHLPDECTVQAVPKLLGGKGGFGSMLRAIGAQIEKTTNREACRDLSGRRLRDINEEKRLKTWIGQQADREQQEAERKQRKLDKLRAEPKHQFSDKQYDEERSQLPDKVHDAVEHGFMHLEPSIIPSTSSEMPSTSKISGKSKKKPKKKGFMFEDEEFDLTDSDCELDTLTEDATSKKRPLESVGEEEVSPSKKRKSLAPGDQDKAGPSSSKELVSAD